MINNCPKCGSILLDGDIQCKQCGYRLNSGQCQEAQAITMDYKSNIFKVQPEEKRFGSILFFLLLFIFIGGVIAYYFM